MSAVGNSGNKNPEGVLPAIVKGAYISTILPELEFTPLKINCPLSSQFKVTKKKMKVSLEEYLKCIDD